MTDKELKKLSRLELLELLLIETHENQRLRDELDKIHRENVVGKSVKQLSETNVQLQAALHQVQSITDSLDKSVVRRTEDVSSTSLGTINPNGNTGIFVDRTDDTLYEAMIAFFLEKRHAMFIFPDELRNRLVKRLEEVADKE